MIRLCWDVSENRQNLLQEQVFTYKPLRTKLGESIRRRDGSGRYRLHCGWLSSCVAGEDATIEIEKRLGLVSMPYAIDAGGETWICCIEENRDRNRSLFLGCGGLQKSCADQSIKRDPLLAVNLGDSDDHEYFYNGFGLC